MLDQGHVLGNAKFFVLWQIQYLTLEKFCVLNMEKVAFYRENIRLEVGYYLHIEVAKGKDTYVL